MQTEMSATELLNDPVAQELLRSTHLSRRRALGILLGGMFVPLAAMIEHRAPNLLQVAAAPLTDRPYPLPATKDQPELCAAFDNGPADALRNGAPEEMVKYKELATGLAASGNKKIIRVAFHLILTSAGKADATDNQVAAQMDALNVAYARTGMQFGLVRLDRTRSDDWVRPFFGSNEERAIMKSLSLDPAHTLNVYSCIPQGGYLGWARFPWAFKREDDYMQGVVIQTGTIPGVYNVPENVYDQGKTAVHETGHYLGVFHTFQGGCTEPGDYCDDTPPEALPAYECDSRNTCSATGKDPIHNFMDYTPDACYHQFTADQAARMHWALATYKPSLTA